MANELMEKTITYAVNGEEVKLNGHIVRNYLTRGNEAVTDQEVVMFLNLCKFQKLNPFLNEAYLIKFKGADAQLITSKEAYMKRAFNDPEFGGFKAGIIVQRGNEILELEGSFSAPKDVLLGGWAIVYVKGKEQPYVTKIGLDEFSKGQATWKNMPKTMIRKTALVQALREAFPVNLGGLYTEDDTENLQENTVKQTDRELQQEKELNANKEVIDIEPIVENNRPKKEPVREELPGQTEIKAPF